MEIYITVCFYLNTEITWRNMQKTVLYLHYSMFLFKHFNKCQKLIYIVHLHYSMFIFKRGRRKSNVEMYSSFTLQYVYI